MNTFVQFTWAILIFVLCFGASLIPAYDADLEAEDSEEEDTYDFDEMLMEPIPENVTLTLELEEQLENDTVLECTTTEMEDDPMMTSEAFLRIRIRRSRWKSFNVYIDPSYNKRDRMLINNGMARLNGILRPCGGLRFGIFRPGARPFGDYVHIIKGNGCWSLIGKIGGKQRLSLQSPGCMGMGTIIHELMHSLGFHHEQNRPDRDDHIKILWQNIPVSARSQFDKRSWREVITYGVKYDQNSNMHYGPNAFSKNGHPTIASKNGKPVGPTGNLTPNDITRLKRMYC